MPENSPRAACICATLDDLACIPMGCDDLDQRFFATVDQLLDHGGDQWWLYLSRCTACGQDWMVAQEARIYDDYFLKRLSRSEAEAICAGGDWPRDFLCYEQVLAKGWALSKACQFFDPLSPSLIETARDLRRERPEITTAEVAELLGIDVAHVELLRPMGRVRGWLWRRERGIKHFPT